MDFKRIKEKLRIKTVLGYYNLLEGLKEFEYRLQGPCPIHKGDNKTAFNVDKEKNLYYCFTRHHGGSVLDLIMEIEGITLIKAGEKALEILGSLGENPVEYEYSDKGNKPLSFSLRLNPNHPYMDRRNISIRTRKYFGIGYCSKGMFAGRICIPIHDENGNLIAYAGRGVDGSEPKYLFPKGFKKSLVIYNYNRVSYMQNCKKVVLAEGYFDVFRLFQAGYPAVALMGSSISSRQIELLVSLKKFLILMFDGDDAGRECTKKTTYALRGKIPFRVESLGKGLQPDMLSEEDIRKILH